MFNLYSLYRMTLWSRLPSSTERTFQFCERTVATGPPDPSQDDLHFRRGLPPTPLTSPDPCGGRETPY